MKASNFLNHIQKQFQEISPDFVGVLNMTSNGWCDVNNNKWEEVSQRTFVVYRLTDQKTNKVFYVGKTNSKICGRLYGHVRQGANHAVREYLLREDIPVLLELFFCTNSAETHLLEAYLIYKDQPCFNTDGCLTPAEELPSLVGTQLPKRPKNVTEGTWLLMKRVYFDLDNGVSRSAVAEKYDLGINKVIAWDKKRSK